MSTSKNKASDYWPLLQTLGEGRAVSFLSHVSRCTAHNYVQHNGIDLSIDQLTAKRDADAKSGSLEYAKVALSPNICCVAVITNKLLSSVTCVTRNTEYSTQSITRSLIHFKHSLLATLFCMVYLYMSVVVCSHNTLC